MPLWNISCEIVDGICILYMTSLIEFLESVKLSKYVLRIENKFYIRYLAWSNKYVRVKLLCDQKNILWFYKIFDILLFRNLQTKSNYFVWNFKLSFTIFCLDFWFDLFIFIIIFFQFSCLQINYFYYYFFLLIINYFCNKNFPVFVSKKINFIVVDF